MRTACHDRSDSVVPRRTMPCHSVWGCVFLQSQVCIGRVHSWLCAFYCMQGPECPCDTGSELADLVPWLHGSLGTAGTTVYDLSWVRKKRQLEDGTVGVCL